MADQIDIETQREQVKSEMRKEYKLKEGAETLLKVAKNKETNTHVRNILKQINTRLKELNVKLDWLNSQVPDDLG